jgi:UDP-N-acetylmuramate: L-alanyl-gamma-D-glutamyl-meso-diaminopimelate ligase
MRGIQVYDDFAHHPTAIATTLAGLRARVGSARVLAAMEPRSNSMRQGAHAAALPGSFAAADEVHVLARPELGWDAGETLGALGDRLKIATSTDQLLAALWQRARSGDHVIFMSNGGFDGASRRFYDGLAKLPGP